jgi:hypothetical protein
LGKRKKGEDTAQFGVGGGGGKGVGGGPARGKGTLEYRNLGRVIPHQGGGKRICWSGPEKGGGALY